MNRTKREIRNKEKVFEVIATSALPIDIERIRVKAGLKAWIQCKALCMELMAEKKILGQKTTKSWVFRAVAKQRASQSFGLGDKVTSEVK